MTKRERLLWTLSWLIRLVVGITFIVAAWPKIVHPDAFALSVYYYHMMPASLLHAFALLVPWLEMVTGIALIIGWGRRGAALLVALLLLMFILGLSTALARGLDISCGCFGTDGGHAVGISLLIRDVAMFLALLLFLRIEKPKDRSEA